ncbi:hypothetical protein MMC18_002860 [Xylographa bjoerkii]|nr:hypothetical protein [Xylographa bjoerkii]
MAHGFFHISKAHRQVFPQWTVPDLREYSNETLARLRNTLVVVDRAIIRELGEARPYQEFRPLPLQSSINLQKPILLTPSLSTIGLSEHESARTASPIISCQESRLVTPTPAATEAANGDILIPAQVTTTDANSLLARAPTIVQSMRGSVANQMAIDQGATDAGELHLHLSDTPHIIEAVKTKPEARDGISLAVSPTSPAELDLGWLNLSIELEDGLEAAFSKAEVTVSCAQECRPGMRRCINLADLVSGEQRLLKRSDDEHGLEFTIANCSEDVVKIKCTWLAA